MSDRAPAVLGGVPSLAGLPPFPSWPQHGPDEEAALLEVLRSDRWGSTHGEVVATFEREFAAAHGAAHAVATCNGTVALVVALRAAGVGLGDEVIVPPYTFIATASAALFVGAVPVFADISPDTHLIDPDSVRAAVTERTRAVIPVHLAGAVADLDALAKIAVEHDIAVIEDCAQAAGAAWRGRPVGALGRAGTFSFQSSKNITAGEGGLVVTDDERTAALAYSFVNVGRVRGGGWYEHERVGYNLRLTEFQAAILRVQLRRLAAQNAARDEAARLLGELLADVPAVRVDREPEPMTRHGRHLFMLRLPGMAADRRDAVVRALQAEGVPASTGYVPLHRNEALLAERRALVERLGQPLVEPECPVADEAATDTVWLPQHVLLGSTEQIRAVATAIATVVAAAERLP